MGVPVVTGSPNVAAASASSLLAVGGGALTHEVLLKDKVDFDDYETLPVNSVTAHMLAGALAGIMEHCVMYPLDSVKVRLLSTI